MDKYPPYWFLLSHSNAEYCSRKGKGFFCYYSKLITMRFCAHKWSLVKRYEVDNVYRIIVRCRWCDKWERREIDISAESSRLIPKMKIERFIIDKPLITE